MPKKSRVFMSIGLVVVAAAALSACSTSTPSAPTTTSAAAAVDLKAAGCPATVVIQTDWNPEADHGHAYELVGPNPVIDSEKKTVTGDLMSGGKSTGVKVEVRAGGPAIGYSSVSAQMYQDPDITLGYVSTDEAIQNSATLQTTAVFAENQISPQMIMWDPATYPDVKTIAELGTALKADGGVVRYFKGAAYMSYLQGAGVLPESVLDGGYTGTPADFVTAKGKDGQQGFATAEPYTYENEIGAWGKKVNYQLINDAGYPIYPEAVSIRTGDKDALSGCLTALVPVLQQADVDYINNPTETNALIIDLVGAYNNGWVYTAETADYGVKTMKDLKIAANGTDGVAGSFDEARIKTVLDLDTPIFTGQGSTLKAGLTAADMFTNEFLDSSIKF
ncbi:ABC transporter substrate-binding protein [Glaciihabitans sp. dw_435]|uniref:ABC transporter substrate-binding protein n=1 Tax=Glaciihabitans sp. dw_435 TaxID=2720081 RepID=UPI001BD4BC23|nr:ABC transporter substrate-binding protein [Glaciihabitans sp. dw_435]